MIKKFIHLPGFIEEDSDQIKWDKAAKDCLNDADEIITMAYGRDDVATLSTFNAPQGALHFLQRDKCLSSCTDETYDEFAEIKQNEELSTTPIWLRKLPFHLQFYLHGSEKFLTTYDQIYDDIQSFIINWRRK